MRTLHKLGIALAVLALTGLAAGQSAKKLKKELKTREAATAKNDADGYVEIAKWAKQKGLLKDSKRLLQKALKVDPDHAAANTALGMVKFDGKWLPKAKAEILQKRAFDASMKKKGLVKVDDIWVDKDKVADAKKGIFWHEGERVSRHDKNAYLAGKVRHPRTGEFIAPEDVAKAESGLFPTEDGDWISEEAADTYHANRDRPWVIRSEYVTLAGTIPLKKLEGHKLNADSAIDRVLPVFLNKHAPPSHRPFVWVTKNAEQYREFGNDVGGAGSAYGAFLAETEFQIPGVGRIRPVFFNNDKDWGPYYVKHASAMAFAYGFCASHDVEAPLWFLRGVGSLAERFAAPGQTAHFGRQHVQKGGVKNIKTWFNSFGINGEMESRMIDYNIFQAGLMLEFAMTGGDDDSLSAIQGISEALAKNPKAAEKAFKKLVKTLSGKEEEVRAHLQKITR